MTDFRAKYHNAVSYKRLSTTSTPKDNFFLFPEHSEFAKKYLFHANYIGTTTVQYPFYMKMNQLDSFLMLYTFEGRGKVFYSDNVYILNPDTILFLDCQNPFELQISDSSLWSYQWLYINGNILPKLYELYKKDSALLFNCSPLSSIHTQITKIINCYQHNKQDELFHSMLINDLITTLILEKKNASSDVLKVPAYVLKVKELFDNSYKESYTLQSLASDFKISKYTLSREFTKHIHTSPIEYLINKRISVSKELLSSTNISINEISQQVGIENPTHFINLFKNRVGMTPLQYRNQKLQ